MDVIALDAVLLRGLMPDVRLRPGMVLPARVLERQGEHGLLWLAGSPVVAELPADLPAGQRLRLAVAGMEADKVLLRVVPEPAAPASAQAAPARAGERAEVPLPAAPAREPGAPAPLAPPVALPLPGGIQARVQVTEHDAGGAEAPEAAEEGPRSVALHYDSPLHGRIELRLTVAADRVSVQVAAAPGPAQALAAGRAGELQAALAAALERPADVRVGTRRDRVDHRA